MSSVAPGARLRRSWPQRFLIAFNCFLIALCVLAASAVGYSYYRFGNIPRVALGDFLTDEPPGQPRNYLLVGSDSRAFVEGGQDLDSFGDEGDSGGQRADTIILVRVDPKAQTASMISFPRDLWVTIVGTNGRKQRINTAFEGGPGQLIETLESNFDIPIHHYAQVDFQGFRELVDAIGGVEVYLDAPVRDRNAEGNNVSGLQIDQTGCVTLDGEQALSYVRSRHYEEFVDGHWQADVTADVGRVNRQQAFVARAVRQALSAGLTNPAKLNGLIGVAERNLTLDEDLDPGDILDLAEHFRNPDPSAIQTYPLPTEVGITDGGASVLFLKEQEAAAALDVFRGVQPGAQVVDPSTMTVSVLNGSGRDGQASDAAQALSARGFNVANTGNAGVQSRTTTVRYGPGERAGAELLASYLEVPPALVEDPTVSSVDAVVVVGLDFTGVAATPRGPEAPADEPPAEPPPPEEDSGPAEPAC